MAGTYAVIVAAGRGHRYGADLPKQYLALAGRSLLHHGAAAFAGHRLVDGVRVVIPPDDRALYDEAVAGPALLEPTFGGASRQASGRRRPISLADVRPYPATIPHAPPSAPRCRRLIHARNSGRSSPSETVSNRGWQSRLTSLISFAAFTVSAGVTKLNPT